MVAKISLSNRLYDCLAYNGEKINKEKGRVLDTNKIFNDGSGTINIYRAFQDFKRWMPQTSRAEKTVMHISLNPHPDDVLTEGQYVEIAREYMEKMGFADMPYIIVKHEDIDRHHIHIVALRVRPDGSAISTKNNFYQSKDVTRELERKYGLHTAERQKITPDMTIKKIDPAGDIKRQVANTVKMIGMRWKFQNLGEYNAILGHYNIKCEQTDGKVNGREYHGLVYYALDDNGNVIASPFKASRLGKFAGREAMEQRYENACQKIDVKPTKKKVASIMAQSSGKEVFVSKLKDANIDLVLRYNAEGRLYGATYIDHNTMSVLNGSRLGKDFSANALNGWFNDPTMKPVVLEESQSHNYSGSTDSDSTSTQSQHQSQTSHYNSQSFEDSSISVPDLGGLFQVGPGFDAQEEAFYREMQRRKKKKKRGPRL